MSSPAQILQSDVFAADLDNVPVIRCWLMDFITPLGLSQDKVFAIDVCLAETLANSIMHGAATQIQLQLDLTPGQISLVIWDDGLAFDPVSATPVPRRAVSLNSPPGGFGLGILQTFAHAITYTRESFWNRLSLEF